MDDDPFPSGQPSRRAVLAALATAGAGSLGGCAGDEVTIDVPDEAPIDEPIEPVVDGLEPGDLVTILSETVRPGSDEVWTAEATFEADDDGRVDLSTREPIEGDYEGVDPMGPFWAMETDEDPWLAGFPYASHDVDVSVSVADADSPTTTETTSRVLYEAETERFEDDVVGTIHLPRSEEPAPAVVLLHGSGGRPLEPLAPLYADHGYVAGSLHYFGEPEPIPDGLVEVPVEYVERAVDQLLEHERVTGESVGVHGISRGGEFALLAGAHVEEIGAIACVVGSGLVLPGLTPDGVSSESSAWSLDGDPVPYVTDPEEGNSHAWRPGVPDLQNVPEEVVQAATIPVERADAPVLAVSGGDDSLWPGVELTEVAMDRLDERSFRYEYDHLVYEDAGHAIHPPYRPTYGTTATPDFHMGGSPAANAAAAADHWPRLLDFFERSLEG